MAVEEDMEIDLGLERKKRMVVEEERRVFGLHMNEPIFWENKKSPCSSTSLWYSSPSYVMYYKTQFKILILLFSYILISITVYFKKKKV